MNTNNISSQNDATNVLGRGKLQSVISRHGRCGHGVGASSEIAREEFELQRPVARPPLLMTDSPNLEPHHLAGRPVGRALRDVRGATDGVGSTLLCVVPVG